MNDFIFYLSALILGYGCISSKFAKSSLSSFCKFIGFVGMFIAYLIKF